MSVPVDTRPLPVEQPPRRRRHVLRNTLIVLVVLVLLAVVAFVVGDTLFRGAAEKQIDTSVEQSFPKGVTGQVHSQIEGGSALVQWLHGSFDDVKITTSDLQVNGGPASAAVQVHGLPVSGGGTVKSADGTLTVSEASVEKLAPLAAADATAPQFGTDTVSTSIKRTVLGVPITVDVTLVPSVKGKYVHLSPTKATLKSGPIAVPGTTLIQTLLPNGISVCAAQYLPPSVRLTDVTVQQGSATLAFTAENVSLDELQQGKTGSC